MTVLKHTKPTASRPRPSLKLPVTLDLPSFTHGDHFSDATLLQHLCEVITTPENVALFKDLLCVSKPPAKQADLYLFNRAAETLLVAQQIAQRRHQTLPNGRLQFFMLGVGAHDTWEVSDILFDIAWTLYELRDFLIPRIKAASVDDVLPVAAMAEALLITEAIVYRGTGGCETSLGDLPAGELTPIQRLAWTLTAQLNKLTVAKFLFAQPEAT